MHPRIAGMFGLASFALLSAAAVPMATAATPPPPELAWAYPVAPPNTSELDPPRGRYVSPDGKRTLTAAQVDKLTPAEKDWFPQSHPIPPAVVLVPGKDQAIPCAECHAVNGQGMVGIPDIAGLPVNYLLEQLAAFRSGARTSALPHYLGTGVMITTARAWSQTDLQAAVAYYASLPRRTPTRVVETEAAPSMRMERWGWTYRDPAGGPTHPLDGSVAEAPESVTRLFMGDLSTRQLVYVSHATLTLGRALIRSGEGGGQPCTACHGANLRGTAIAPPLAGRDPGYLARQLWDIRSGVRSGGNVKLMQGPARGLTTHDITAVAGYLASLTP